MLETDIQNLTKSIELLIAKMDTYLKPVHDSGTPPKESLSDIEGRPMSTKDLTVLYIALSKAGYKETVKSKLSDYGVDLVRDLKDPKQYKSFCNWMVIFAKKQKIKT